MTIPTTPTVPTAPTCGLHTIACDDGVTLLEIRGGIDTATVGPLTATVDALVRPAETLVLDLTRVTYLGSKGIALLTDAQDRARACAGRLVVVPGPDNRAVLRPLSLFGLDLLLDLAPTTAADAVRRAAGGPGVVVHPAGEGDPHPPCGDPAPEYEPVPLTEQLTRSSPAERRRFLDSAAEAGIPDTAAVYVRTKDYGARARVGTRIATITLDDDATRSPTR